jgi:hypothetical protein
VPTKVKSGLGHLQCRRGESYGRFLPSAGGELPRIKTVLFPRRKHPRVYLATDIRVEGHEFTFTAHSVQLGTQGMSLEYVAKTSSGK